MVYCVCMCGCVCGMYVQCTYICVVCMYVCVCDIHMVWGRRGLESSYLCVGGRVTSGLSETGSAQKRRGHVEATLVFQGRGNTSVVGEKDTPGCCGAVRPFWKERGLPWWCQGVSAFSIQAMVGVNGKPQEGTEHHSIYLGQSEEMSRSQ
jgi:hypothetical protein